MFGIIERMYIDVYISSSSPGGGTRGEVCRFQQNAVSTCCHSELIRCANGIGLYSSDMLSILFSMSKSSMFIKFFFRGHGVILLPLLYVAFLLISFLLLVTIIGW